MELYAQFVSRPDLDFYSRNYLREESPPPFLQQQAQLPSFRDIIPPHLHTAIETQPHSNISFEGQSDILTPTSQPLSATSRSIVASPAQSNSSSMPSLTEGFEEVSVRHNDNMFSTPSHAMRTMDRGSSWIPSTQYSDMSTTYAPTTQRVPQLNSQQQSARVSPNLPPIRDINQRGAERLSGYDQSYTASSNGLMSQVPQMSPYSSNTYGTTQSAMGELDTFGTRRVPYFQNSYPPTTRPYSSYNTTYGFSNGYSGYPEANYQPYPVISSQATHYGLTTDASGVQHRRRRGNLPKPVTDILRNWFHEHLDHPYPSEEDKQLFIQRTGLTISQISNWFINARRRHWPALRQNRDRLRNTALRRSNSGGASI